MCRIGRLRSIIAMVSPLLELGLPGLAQRRFESAIEEFPRYPAAHYQLGLLHETDGDNAKALERFRSVAILDAANFDLVLHLQELGNAALANEAYAEAVDSYQLILRYYPEHASIPELRYITGFLLVEELEDYGTGLPLLESAIQQNPDTSFHEKAFFPHWETASENRSAGRCAPYFTRVCDALSGERVGL